MLQVHDGGSMDAQERRWIEFRFNSSHRFSQHVAFFPGRDTKVVSFGRDGTNFSNFNKDDAPFVAKDEPLHIAFGGAVRGLRSARLQTASPIYFFAGALQRALKALRYDWLQKIIQSI